MFKLQPLEPDPKKPSEKEKAEILCICNTHFTILPTV